MLYVLLAGSSATSSAEINHLAGPRQLSADKAQGVSASPRGHARPQGTQCVGSPVEQEQTVAQATPSRHGTPPSQEGAAAQLAAKRKEGGRPGGSPEARPLVGLWLIIATCCDAVMPATMRPLIATSANAEKCKGLKPNWLLT